MATLVELRCEIATRMHQGIVLIDRGRRDGDERHVRRPESALWLYGWSFVAPRDQRREAHAHLARLTDTEGSG